MLYVSTDEYTYKFFEIKIFLIVFIIPLEHIVQRHKVYTLLNVAIKMFQEICAATYMFNHIPMEVLFGNTMHLVDTC